MTRDAIFLAGGCLAIWITQGAVAVHCVTRDKVTLATCLAYGALAFIGGCIAFMLSIAIMVVMKPDGSTGFLLAGALGLGTFIAAAVILARGALGDTGDIEVGRK
jgi:hypothetical protein